MQDFAQLEIDFLEAADDLPEEYAGVFLPPLKEEILIPGRHSRVGGLRIRVFEAFISVRIGDHTEARFTNATQTVEFIKSVVTDRIVFYFGEAGVDYYDFDDFENLSQADQDYYVWSGPFHYAFLDRKE